MAIATGTLVIGGGPSSIGMLLAASRHGRLRQLLAGGFTLVTMDAQIGPGGLPAYAISSDTTAETLLSAVVGHPDPTIASIRDEPCGQFIAEYIGKLGVPLAQLREYLTAIGARLSARVAEGGGKIITRTKVVRCQRRADGAWRCRLAMLDTNKQYEIVAERVLIAAGADQSWLADSEEDVAGVLLSDIEPQRLMGSDAVLQIGGVEKVRARLAGKACPRIVVVGGSTSALSVATILLKPQAALKNAGAIAILHRQKFVPFYESVDAAHADGFFAFDAEDVCPVTGFVYRSAGARLESRELVRSMLGLSGRQPDPRLTTHMLTSHNDAAAQQRIREADLVVAALGYRPRGATLLDECGQPILLQTHWQRDRPLVDSECRVLDIAGRPIAGAYGVGLAAGYRPQGTLGGEPSFKGQVNSLWLWQNDLGLLVADKLSAPLQTPAALGSFGGAQDQAFHPVGAWRRNRARRQT